MTKRPPCGPSRSEDLSSVPETLPAAGQGLAGSGDRRPRVLAFYSFPAEHRRQIWSTNSLERLNKEVSRRCDVVGIFPNRSSLLRLVGAVLEEQHDEWQVGRRYFSTESMNKLLQPTSEEVMQTLLELESA